MSWQLACVVSASGNSSVVLVNKGCIKCRKRAGLGGVTGLLCQADHSWMEPELNLQASHRMMTQEILELMDSSPFPGQENHHTRAKKEGQCALSTLAPSVSLSSVHGVWCGSW